MASRTLVLQHRGGVGRAEEATGTKQGSETQCWDERAPGLAFLPWLQGVSLHGDTALSSTRGMRGALSGA